MLQKLQEILKLASDHLDGFMTINNVNRSLLGPKSTIKVGGRNVRTMFEPSKTIQVTREMNRYKLDNLVISETR